VVPAALIPKDEVITRLTRVFREVGYESATLSRLSEATGLVRASLYHYFPGGKEDMAAAVLARANEWLEEHALAPLAGPGPPPERLIRMIVALDGFYAGGQDACLLGLLALGASHYAFQSSVQAALTRWTDALAALAEDAGLPADLARARAEDAVIRIQGALVVSRGLATTEPFARTLRDLPGHLLAPAAFPNPEPDHA